MLSDPNTPTGAEPADSFPGRKDEASKYRQTQADFAATRDPQPVKNLNNGEEWELKSPETGRPSFAANSTKGMPHDEKRAEVTFSTLSKERKLAYQFLLDAVNSQDPADFAKIPTGPNPMPQGPTDPVVTPSRPFVDPQNGVAFDLEGPDAPSASTYRGSLEPKPISLAPTFSSADLASDVGEVYLMALARDVPVNRLHNGAPSDARVNDAVRLMNEFSSLRVPVDKTTRKVTIQTLFRGGNVLGQQGSLGNQSVGELVGPYVSQFMIIGSRLDSAFPPSLTIETGDKREAGLAGSGISLRRDQGRVLYGTLTIDQKHFEVQPGLDFVTSYDTWFQILQGVRPQDLPRKEDRSSQYTGQSKFLYSLRQMAEYVHRDQTYQEGLIAALLILSMNERAERTRQNLFNPGNVYRDVPNQTGFGSFGNGHVLALLAEVNTRAIKAAWNQKWFNQRRLRPEVLGGRIHNVRTNEAVTPERYRINAEISGVPFKPIKTDQIDLTQDTAPGKEIMERIAEYNKEINAKNGRPTDESFLLPQQYPEGSPTHPSYPAGHATQIAAEVTVLKGLFNENFVITDKNDPALVPNDDGSALVPFTPLDQPQIELKLGDELNKLAANVSLARSIAGVHYRLDYSESVLLGEYVGLGILQEQARQFNQARRGAVSKDTFFFELTLFSGIKVRILANGDIVQV